jgi:DNA-binding MarR family transcriptional regulator
VARGAGKPADTRTETPGDGIAPLADRLHRAAIHLLRRLRKVDEATGLTPPQASALSVLVFGGPRTLNGLAAAEQVKAPTMSRLVADMEREGLATKTTDEDDRRVVHIAPTELGRSLLEAGRARRLDVLKAELADLAARDRAVLANAAAILERLNRAGAATRNEKEPAGRR